MKQPRRCYTPGPRSQRRMRVLTWPGPSLQAPAGILSLVRHRDACNAVSPSPALGREPHQTQMRDHSQSSPKLRNATREPPRRGPVTGSTNTESCSARHDAVPRLHSASLNTMTPSGRASLENTLRMQGRSPSALRDAAIANDDLPRSRPTDLAFSCKARAATTQPAGPGARRRPSTDSRADLAEGQDGCRAALTDATPSWAAPASRRGYVLELGSQESRPVASKLQPQGNEFASRT